MYLKNVFQNIYLNLFWLIFEVKYSLNRVQTIIASSSIHHRTYKRIHCCPWRLFGRCGSGHLATVDGKACTVRSDCLSAPCQHGGLCVDGGPGQKYRCVCPDSYTGQRCQLAQERQTLKLGVGALCTIVGCLLLILCKWYTNHFIYTC